MTRLCSSLLFVLALASLDACGKASTPPPATPTPTPAPVAQAPSESAIRHLNLGNAYLEQHRFGQAVDEFSAALTETPDYLEARVNLAIALAAQVKYPEALAELDRALAMAPDNPVGLYMRGLLHKYQGEKEPAIEAFEGLLKIDPHDTDTKYNLATLYKDRRELDRAIPLLEEVIEAAPYFISAYYSLGQAYLRLGMDRKDDELRQKGQVYIERFQELSGGATAETAGLRYGEQGRYSMALEDRSAKALPPLTPRFDDVAVDSGIDFLHAPVGPSAIWGSGVLVFDLDDDGDDDVLLAGSATGPGRLFRNDGHGRFEDVTDASGLAKLRGPGVGVAAGHLVRGQAPHLLLAGRLLASSPQLVFSDVTNASGLGKGLDEAASVSFIDLDHDGDLDVAASVPGSGVPIWSNDGAGNLEASTDTGLLGSFGALSLVASDLDLDRDVDLLVGVDGESPRQFSNNRDLTFTDRSAVSGLAGGGPTRGVTVGDLDDDGWPDLVITNATADHHLIWKNTGGRFVELQRLPATSPGAGCAVLDADLDGDLDLFVGEATGLRYFRNDDGQFVDQTAASGLDRYPVDVRGLAAGDVDGDGDFDLVANVYSGQALLLRNSGAESRSWIKVRAVGTNSNPDGFATKLDVHSAKARPRLEARGGDGFLSQSSSTLGFGLGDETQLDRLRLLWPGGVLQAELELEVGRLHRIEELDRKGSSCPFLWTWDGQQIAFVSDIQGGSPLGLRLAPGVHNLPDPVEWFLLPAGLARPRDGAYDLRITESLEEIAYLDRAMLRVIDAPRGVRVLPNERLLLVPPFTEEGLHFIRREIPPQAATDAGGNDAAEVLRSIDRRFVGARQRAFRGIADPWSLTLEFPNPGPLEAGQRLVLMAHGYIEFSNSTPIYAASQAGIGIQLPSLDVLDQDGRVVATIADAGAPAGLPKWMVLDITDHLPRRGPVRLRYATNLEVYFDQVRLGITDPTTAHQVTDVEAAVAELRWAGYPSLWTPDGRLPMLYRYDELLPDETWQSQEGAYTRLGDVRELLAAADDLPVVMTHGDELTLRFPTATLPRLGADQDRHLVLFSIGYAKDLDPHSAQPQTVGPLPYRAMTEYPYSGPGPLADAEFRAELAKWSSRYVRANFGTPH